MLLKKLIYLLLLAPSLCSSGTVEQVEIKGRPSIQVDDDGSVKMCGMVLTVRKEQTTREGYLSTLIFVSSMSVDSEGRVLLRASAHSVDQGKDGKAKLSEIPLETFWIKSGKEKATVPYRGVIIRGNEDHSILYIDEHGLRKSSAFIESMVQNRPIMIGAKTRKETYTKVFSGPIKVSQGDLKSFEGCNLELVEVMESKR